MTQHVFDISKEVLAIDCSAAVEASYAFANEVAFTHQITAQCGDRGLQTEKCINRFADTASELENQHKTSVARLCAAMCIGCPNKRFMNINSVTHK